MNYIELTAKGVSPIRFKLYDKKSPITCKAFTRALPLVADGVQARFAGEEIWIQKGPSLRIGYENASVNLKAGELGYAPPMKRSEIGRSIALVYGKARLSGRVNLFAHVYPQDLKKLKKLGERVWLTGKTTLRFKLKEF